jgi:hypothetical protein
LAHSDRLDAAQLDALDARLTRLDRAAEDGPWTAKALAIVAECPDTATITSPAERTARRRDRRPGADAKAVDR